MVLLIFGALESVCPSQCTGGSRMYNLQVQAEKLLYFSRGRFQFKINEKVVTGFDSQSTKFLFCF